MYLTWIFSLMILCSCQQETTPLSTWQEMDGRDEGLGTSRSPLYRAKVPHDWLRQDPLVTESIVDTRQANCTFLIQEGHQTIRVTVHTFPSEILAQRIPPKAHIKRWEGQFDALDLLQMTLTPQVHGGFNGLCLEAQGTIKGAATKVLGWFMQLDLNYYRQLSWESSPVNKQKRADYAIKASGAPEFIDQQREAIFNFVNSFELIDELPSF